MLHHRIVGEGQPMLALHGATLDHHHMVDVLEPAFHETEGWQRIYVDLPGHGQSPACGDIRTQDDLLRAILDFADAVIGDRTFAVAGLSRGSYLARGIIHERPGQVTGAALIVPGGNPSSPHPLPVHRVIEPDPSLRPGLSDDLLWAYDNHLVVQRRDILEKRRRIITPAKQQCDQAQHDRLLRAFDFSFAASEEAMVFDRPSLIVAGRQDSMSGYLDAIDLMHRFPRATLAVLDGAGHSLAWERAEALNTLLRDWLNRLAAAPET